MTLIVLATGAVVFVLLVARNQGDAPAAIVRSLCADEVNHEYLLAYQLTTPDASGLTPDQFIQWSQQRDEHYGVVTRCAITGRDYIRLFGPTQAAYTISVVFANGTTASGDINVYNVTPATSKGDFYPQPAQWLIGNLDAPLHLSP